MKLGCDLENWDFLKGIVEEELKRCRNDRTSHVSFVGVGFEL